MKSSLSFSEHIFVWLSKVLVRRRAAPGRAASAPELSLDSLETTGTVSEDMAEVVGAVTLEGLCGALLN